MFTAHQRIRQMPRINNSNDIPVSSKIILYIYNQMVYKPILL